MTTIKKILCALDLTKESRSAVLRLQTIVSRELAASDAAVVPIGSLQAGPKENVIPDEAVIKLTTHIGRLGQPEACAGRELVAQRRQIADGQG